MNEEITLIMPCLACEPGCEWPVGGASQPRCTLSGMNVFSCPDCEDFNDTYLPTFLDKTETVIQINCAYEFFFPSLICTAERLLFTSSRFKVSRNLTLTVDFFNDQGGPLWRWQETFFGPEKETNGPFVLPATVGFFICDLIGVSTWSILGI